MKWDEWMQWEVLQLQFDWKDLRWDQIKMAAHLRDVQQLLSIEMTLLFASYGSQPGNPHWDKMIRSLEIRNTPFGNSSDDYMVMKWVSCLNQGFPHFDHVPNWERRCPIAVTWTMILLWGDCLVHAAISRFGSINILMKRSSFSIRSKVYPDLVGQSVDDVTV